MDIDFELLSCSALELSRRVRARAASPVEIARNALAAIERFNPPLNAVVTVDPEFTLDQALEVERRLAAGELADSPLAGVPYLAKDLDVTAWMRTTFGSRLTERYVPKWDMRHIERLRAAGCVLLGKTNTPEDGVIPNSRNPVFGATKNPWRLDRCAGGSSGGSGAAVAAGLAPIATGSDGAGSIRIPAAMNGCFGFKPTFGTIPFGPKGIGIMNTIGHLGPMSRNVTDAAAMLDAMAGADERDRASLPRAGSFAAALEAPFKPWEIAFSVDLGYAPVRPDVRECFMKTIEALGAAGWPLEEARPRFGDPFRAVETFIAVEWGTVPFKLKTKNPAAYEMQSEDLKRVAEERARLTLEDLWRANAVRKDVCFAMGEFFQEVDLLLTPTLPRGAFELERAWPEKPGAPGEDDRTLNSLLYPFNLTGDPAASLMIGLDDEGLPIGLQIVGPRHADGRVLRAALECERAGIVDARRPPHGAHP